ncbi:MAG: hypothetical protein AAGB14_12300, partial [Verrucomicrobiota bacterium]
MTTSEWTTIFTAAGILLLHVVGILHVVHALMNVRTSQGTVAWIVCLVGIPWVAIPLYWIAGRNRFSGYVHSRRNEDERLRQVAKDMHERLRHYEIRTDDPFSRAADHLIGLPL